jgi:signal transduction histidine kinase/ActR/RegA family two-component response regulator
MNGTATSDELTRRRLEEVLAFEERVGLTFSQLKSPQELIGQVPALAVPELGDLCVAELRTPPDSPSHVASAHVDRLFAAALRSIADQVTRLPGVKGPVARAYATGSPELVESFRPTEPPEAAIDVRRLVLAKDLGVASLLVLPLGGRGAAFGVVVLATREGRSYSPRDVSRAASFARRAAQAIESGRLFAELNDASQAKDRFLAVLSHELRTPLTPVLLAVESLLARGVPEPPQLTATLEMIRRNVELEARIVDDLLDLTRVARGRFELSLEVVDVHEAVDHAVEVCRRELAEKGLRLAVERDARRHHVRADPVRLQQILRNLLKNAVKFTPSGGEVTVRTRDGEGRVLVSVSDTGIGIEGEDLARIFGTFVQADPSIGRRYGGLGLGLSISKTLAEAHGGTLVADSDGDGRGATFTLSLRVVEPPPAAEAPPEAAREKAAPDHAVRVLVVDDDPDTLELTSEVLRDSGFEVATASGVASALGEAKRGRFDVLVSDIGLPDGSGLDLMRELRAAGEAPLGIALSGYGTRDDIDRSRQAGFTRHLTKPISIAALESALREVTRGR